MSSSAVSASSPLWLQRKWTFDFFVVANLVFRLPCQPIKFRRLNKNDMFGRGLLKEHFCKYFVVKISLQ